MLPRAADVAEHSSNAACACVGLAHEQMRLTEEHQRLVAPRAPDRLRRDGERGIGHRALGSGGAHHGAEHRAGGVERRRAVVGSGIEARGC